MPFVSRHISGEVLQHGIKIVLIGSMSFVNKDCLEEGKYVGIPAKILKE